MLKKVTSCLGREGIAMCTYKAKVIQAYLGIFMHIPTNTGIFGNYFGTFGYLCRPGMFRTLVS